MMRLQQLDHVAISCRAPGASKEWYQRVLGFEQVYADQWGGKPIFLRLGSTYLALFPCREGCPETSSRELGISHFALRAATQRDFREAQEHLRLLGIEFYFEDHEIAHSVYFKDPDGYQVEITTYDVES